ncbi:hypothetical protein HK100_002126 [Physocladia obscura]|uniref:Uncharacterized protein n=1 Tax=Physocladia obscura TaxID=109957 RepID=A0AAD5SW51_9FUNG|nr:hypothetical protein HK100_002126 [Physocladia obscura]
MHVMLKYFKVVGISEKIAGLESNPAWSKYFRLFRLISAISFPKFENWHFTACFRPHLLRHASLFYEAASRTRPSRTTTATVDYKVSPSNETDTDANVVRILHWNRHSAVYGDVEAVIGRLGVVVGSGEGSEAHSGAKVRLVRLEPGALVGGLGQKRSPARALVDAGVVAALCHGFRAVIVSDTAPDARALFESLHPNTPPHLRCNASVIVHLTTRFDWAVSDFDDYHALLWQLVHSSSAPNPSNSSRPSNSILWAANNPLESRVLADDTNAAPPFRLLRPLGISSVKAVPINSSLADLAILLEPNPSKLVIKMRNLGIPFYLAPDKHYGGPRTLKKFKAVIEFPYQVSTMKLYENLAAGIVMLIPSPQFFRELVETEMHQFGPWNRLRRHADWPRYMDYYSKAFKNQIYYFDSWAELNATLAKSAKEIDDKNVREWGPAAYEKHVANNVVLGWAQLLSDAGVGSMTVDGRPLKDALKEKNGDENDDGIKLYHEKVRFPEPKDESEWRTVTLPSIKKWQDAEAKRQDAIRLEYQQRARSERLKQKKLLFITSNSTTIN